MSHSVCRFFFFIINGELPSLNEYINACRGNKYNSNNLKKMADNRVVMAINQAIKDSFEGKLRVPIACVDFKIHWFCKDKRKDKDNIMFAKKFIFDGCAKAGIIKNDGWKHIGNIAETLSIDKHCPRIEVSMNFRKII
jgi:Holliday junction resolvase RusA-like endonuclease